MQVNQPFCHNASTYNAEQAGMGHSVNVTITLAHRIILLIIVGDNTKGPKPTATRPAAKVRFAVDVEAHAGPTAEPTKQDRRAPIKIVGGRAWSPGIYQALRLLGKSLDVAWEKAFIRPLTFNL